MSVSDREPGPAAPAAPSADGMVWIPGATFTMGSERHYPEEAPAHRVPSADSGSIPARSPTANSAGSCARPDTSPWPSRRPIRPITPAPGRTCSSRSPSCSCRPGAGLAWPIRRTGGRPCPVRTGATRRVPAARSVTSQTIPWCMSPGTVARPMQHGASGRPADDAPRCRISGQGTATAVRHHRRVVLDDNDRRAVLDQPVEQAERYSTSTLIDPESARGHCRRDRRR